MKAIYNTDSEIRENLDGTKYAITTKVAGNMNEEYVRLHPILPKHIKLSSYIGIGFMVTHKFNFLKLYSDYGFIKFMPGDVLTIHFEGFEQMIFKFEERPGNAGNKDWQAYKTMIPISDNQLIHLNDVLVSHISYSNRADNVHTICKYAEKYNCQYDNPEDGAELLKTVAMRICGSKIIMLHQKEKKLPDGFEQYELIK